MTKKPIVPADFAHFSSDWHMSPGIDAGGFVFLSGITGVRADGGLSRDPKTQFRDAFDIVGQHLAAASLGFDDIVEMTSYHVGLREHLAAFMAAKDSVITAPYPAWTAIGVTELITEGALAEIRVIAKRRSDG